VGKLIREPAWTGDVLRTAALCALLLLLLTSCRTPPPATAAATPPADFGLASFYGPGFQGKRTASGVPFDARALVAAHPTYPFGTVLRVTNLTNGRTVDVRVVDRGPAAGPRKAGVIIDVSRAAAERLDFVRSGRTKVRVERLPASAAHRQDN
jgi:rare lipoprotein A